MKEIADREKLALLGFGDPIHSLAWYKKFYDNLPAILEEYIVATLNEFGTFPKESKDLKDVERYRRFYLLLDINSGQYVVKINNTDRNEIMEENCFSSCNAAAKFFISKSFTAGGAIWQYWNK